MDPALRHSKMQPISMLLARWTGAALLAVFLGLPCRAEPAPEPPGAAVSALASESYAERETAQKELLDWGRTRREAALPIFLKLAESADDPEVRERCMSILRELVGDDYRSTFEGFIGISLSEMAVRVPGEKLPRQGVNVSMVFPGTPGERDGLLVNDVIIAVNGKSWERNQLLLPLFQEKIRNFKPGTRVELRVLRAGKTIEVPVVLGGMVPYRDRVQMGTLMLDPAAIERAGVEAYFRNWLAKRRASKQ